jgi:Flp pilus assembly protein TadB
MIAVMLLLGAGVGGGIVLVVWGIRPRPAEPVSAPTSHAALFPDLPARLARAAAAGLVAGLLTRWPVAIVAGGGFGFFASDLLSAKSHRDRDVDRSEAIAAWAEMLRDTITAVSGLEEAIVATAGLVPTQIRAAIQDLVIRLERQSLSASLAQLAEDLGDPTADLVIAALALAARGEAKELGELLSSLADTARENASMRVRVDAVRAGTRTAVRIISSVTVATMALLLLLNRGYLQPFDTAVGQVTLVVIFAGFAAGLIWLSAMSRYQAPERFIVSVGLEETTH